MTNLPADPLFSLVGFGVLCTIAGLVFWPRHGLLARISRYLELTDRVLAEDALKLLVHRHTARPDDLAQALQLRRRRLERVLGRLVATGLVAADEGALTLTEEGRAHAVQIVKAHRLWERYLADRTGVSEAEWHAEAERQEHRLSPEDTERLYARMGRPLFDPHGDPIPYAPLDVPPLEGVPLAELDAGDAAVIVHLEDEPDSAYRRLLAAGLATGQRLSAGESDADTVRLRTNGHDVALSRADAESVTVRRLDEPAADAPVDTLADLPEGESATVVGLSPRCVGPQRRRLLDLGVVPGTSIAAEMASALGDPMAFRVRGALIALRRHQASWVQVRRGLEARN